jgi:hypothetical protein
MAMTTIDQFKKGCSTLTAFLTTRSRTLCRCFSTRLFTSPSPPLPSPQSDAFNHRIRGPRTANTRPVTRLRLTGPYVLLSSVLRGSSASPSNQTWFHGTICVSFRHGSRVVTRSPGRATIRLMAMWEGFAGDLY